MGISRKGIIITVIVVTVLLGILLTIFLGILPNLRESPQPSVITTPAPTPEPEISSGRRITGGGVTADLAMNIDRRQSNASSITPTESSSYFDSSADSASKTKTKYITGVYRPCLETTDSTEDETVPMKENTPVTKISKDCLKEEWSNAGCKFTGTEYPADFDWSKNASDYTSVKQVMASRGKEPDINTYIKCVGTRFMLKSKDSGKCVSSNPYITHQVCNQEKYNQYFNVKPVAEGSEICTITSDSVNNSLILGENGTIKYETSNPTKEEQRFIISPVERNANYATYTIKNVKTGTCLTSGIDDVFTHVACSTIDTRQQFRFITPEKYGFLDFRQNGIVDAANFKDQCPEGWREIDGDLNADCSGDTIKMCVKYGTDEFGLRNISIVKQTRNETNTMKTAGIYPSNCPAGQTKVDYSFKKGACTKQGVQTWCETNNLDDMFFCKSYGPSFITHMKVLTDQNQMPATPENWSCAQISPANVCREDCKNDDYDKCQVCKYEPYPQGACQDLLQGCGSSDSPFKNLVFDYKLP